MVSMADVARRANVALSTVSYALNGTRPVSRQTTERIERAMKELGYRPNALARGLASKRSRNIALVFPAVERGLGITEMEFVSSAAEAAREHGYHLVLWTTTVDDTDALARLTQEGLVDGVILMEVHLRDARVDLLRETEVPFCMIGRTEDSGEDSYADIDFARTIHDAFAFLARLGHRTVGFVNQSAASYEKGYGPSVRAARGVVDAADALNLTALARFCEESPGAGRAALADLLVEAPDLTGLVVLNERAVAGVMAGIAERGARVPDDFSVLTIASSVRVAEMAVPPLTTYSPPSSELGRLGVRVLIDKLEGRSGPLLHQMLPCVLSVGESTGPARNR